MSARPWDRLKLGALMGTLALSAVALAVQPPGRVQAPPRAAEPAPASKVPIPRGPLDSQPLVPALAPKDEPEPAERSRLKLVDFHGSPDDIKPLPLAPIPDDPPPHEGAMISLPYVVQPPDVVRVEVLQAAPGKPIQGPRLIRMDGTISLDFYGDLDVVGLRATQIKEKVVLHLREYLDDIALDLVKIDETTGDPALDAKGNPVAKAPAASGTVYVDVEQYNSATYYVQGDVGRPGRFPFTGRETVLDALNYAGGFLPTFDERDINLARPARAGKPARVFKVDHEAIVNRGESATNYQIFPGDRITVGRNSFVKATVELNRLAEPFSLVANQIYTYSLMMKGLKDMGVNPLSFEEREAILRDWAKFWQTNALRPGGPAIDESSLREWLVRRPLPGAAAQPKPKPPE